LKDDWIHCDSQKWRQSGLKSGGRESGFEKGGIVCPKSSTDGCTQHMIEGMIPGIVV